MSGFVQGKIFKGGSVHLAEALPVMRRMVLRIFAQAGPDNFPWQVTRQGKKAFGTGMRFLSTLREESGENLVMLAMGRGLPDILAHHFGTVIQHPGSDKLQAWRDLATGKLVVTRGTKPHAIPIPARPLMAWMDPEKQEIAGTLLGQMVTFQNVEVSGE